MSFDLYFASTGNTDMENLLNTSGCNRLFTQLEKHSIKKCVETYDLAKCKLFIDSGAFTTWTKGKSIDVDLYIDYINSLDSYITLFAQVDSIPGMFGKRRNSDDIALASSKTWENYLYMKDKVKSRDKLVPIFHQEENFSQLEKMLAYRHSDGTPIRYIGISPSNDMSQKDKEDFISRSFSIIKKSSNKDVKTHAFGMTNLKILEKYPYTSADSTSWKLSAAYGYIFTSKGNILISNAQKNNYKHISNMPRDYILFVKNLCDKYNIIYDRLYTDFGTRAKFNIMYLKDWADNYKYSPNVFYKDYLF